MEAPRRLEERSLVDLVQQAVAARVAGRVVLRDREGLRHGVWVEHGYVVGVHVAGRFDPLLELLRRGGALSTSLHRRCVAALYATPSRSGLIAREIGGVEQALVGDVLKQQVVARFAALVEHASAHGHDAQLERAPVPDDERTVRMPLASVLRRAGLVAPDPVPVDAEREAARRALRALARQLHPDQHGNLDEATRALLTRALASATAAYHGFRSRA